MPESKNDHLKDSATLTRAVENVFRKLIRFLVGRISLVKLQEMISFIYVEETELRLKTEHPGKNVPLTKIALITGLDTRAVASWKRKIERSGHLYRQQFLRELTPESAIVEAWAANVSKSNNKLQNDPRILSYGDDDSGFEKLFRSTITSRGITTQSILERLLATKSVIQHKDNRTVELIVDQFSPYLSDDEQNIVNAALSAISNLISTIEHNVKFPVAEKFFQRQIWSFRLRPEKLVRFRANLREFLEEMEHSARLMIEPWEAETFEEEFKGVGLGLYYFEETDQRLANVGAPGRT